MHHLTELSLGEEGVKVSNIFPKEWISTVEVDALFHDWDEFKEGVGCLQIEEGSYCLVDLCFPDVFEGRSNLLNLFGAVVHLL